MDSTETHRLRDVAESAEQRLDDTKSAYKQADAECREAVGAYNTALLRDAGIVLGKTIVQVPPRRKWDTKSVCMYATSGSPHTLGLAVGYEVTSKNRRWSGRRMRAFKIGEAVKTDREVDQ